MRSLEALAAELSLLTPGHSLCVDERDLDRIGPAQLQGSLGPIWTPAERVLEAIVGAAFEFTYSENHDKRTVTFVRLAAPLAGGLRSYVSPDRRHLFKRRSDGIYVMLDFSVRSSVRKV